MLPAGCTLHVKNNLPIRDCNACFVHLSVCRSKRIEVNSDFLHSIGILASIVSTMPRKVRHVVGTLTYSVLT